MRSGRFWILWRCVTRSHICCFWFFSETWTCFHSCVRDRPVSDVTRRAWKTKCHFPSVNVNNRISCPSSLLFLQAICVQVSTNTKRYWLINHFWQSWCWSHYWYSSWSPPLASPQPLTALFNLCSPPSLPSSVLHPFPSLSFYVAPMSPFFLLLFLHPSLFSSTLPSFTIASASLLPFSFLSLPLLSLPCLSSAAPLHFIKPSLCVFSSCSTPEWLHEKKGCWLTYDYPQYACCISALYLQNWSPSLLFLLSSPSFLPLLFMFFSPPGRPGSDLALYGEAASDHGADGVLPGGHQGERPQRISAGEMQNKRRCFFFLLEATTPTFIPSRINEVEPEAKCFPEHQFQTFFSSWLLETKQRSQYSHINRIITHLIQRFLIYGYQTLKKIHMQ